MGVTTDCHRLKIIPHSPLSLEKGRGDPDSANDHPQTQSSRETVSYFPESKLLLCGISMEIYGNSQSRRAVTVCL